MFSLDKKHIRCWVVTTSIVSLIIASLATFMIIFTSVDDISLSDFVSEYANTAFSKSTATISPTPPLRPRIVPSYISIDGRILLKLPNPVSIEEYQHIAAHVQKVIDKMLTQRRESIALKMGLAWLASATILYFAFSRLHKTRQEVD